MGSIFTCSQEDERRQRQNRQHGVGLGQGGSQVELMLRVGGSCDSGRRQYGWRAGGEAPGRGSSRTTTERPLSQGLYPTTPLRPGPQAGPLCLTPLPPPSPSSPFYTPQTSLLFLLSLLSLVIPNSLHPYTYRESQTICFAIFVLLLVHLSTNESVVDHSFYLICM